MSLSGPPTTSGGPGPVSPRGAEPKRRAAADERLPGLRDLLLPIGEPTRLHTIAVSVALVLDAVWILVVPPETSGVAATGAATYLVLPAAASLYMSLVSRATVDTRRSLGLRTGQPFLPPLALAWAIALVVFVAISGGGGATAPAVFRSPGLLAACLLGTGLPLAILWSGGSFTPGRRRVGTSAALLPSLLGLAVMVPALRPDGGSLVTALTLFAGSLLFFISGYYLGAPPTPREPGRLAPPISTGTSPPAFPSLAAPRPAVERTTIPFETSATRVPAGRAPAASGRPSRTKVSTGWPDVVSSGFRGLDNLLMGGFPRRGQVAVVGEVGLGRERVLTSTLFERLRRGDAVVVVTASVARKEITDQIEREGPGFSDYERAGKVEWVDLSTRGSPSTVSPEPAARRPLPVRWLESMLEAANRARAQSTGGFVLAFFGVDSMIESLGRSTGVAVLRNLVGILRQRGGLALYSITLNSRSRSILPPVMASLDGVLLVRYADGRRFVKVFRLGPVESRAWVECSFEDRGPVLRLPPTPPESRRDVPTSSEPPDPMF